jgi:ParB family protein of integrating conjugative element (PFGI_1 class)
MSSVVAEALAQLESQTASSTVVLPCSGDPTVSTAMQVEITRIRPYPRNPRRVRNTEYDRIKASMRVNGMTQPLVITRAPGEETYTVAAGGNTRLQILDELYQETGSERFRQVHCHFVPWTSESDVLLAHLRENDLRGPLRFIDRARAIREIQRLIETETGSLSLRQLSQALAARGYQVSPALLSQMVYAVDMLLPLIPQALEAGMGQPQVQRIRTLEHAAGRLWDSHLADTEPFAPVFAALCRRQDGPDWDLQRLRRALELEIAERADLSLQQVSLALDAQLNSAESQLTTKNAGEGAAIDADADPIESGPDDIAVVHPPSQGRESVAATDEPLCRAPTFADDTIESAAERLITTGRPGPTDLKSLRARAWTLAMKLAQPHGIGDLVRPLSGQGLGYVLTDVPQPELAELLDESELARVSLLWWQLAACAELTVAPMDALLPSLPEGSVLRRALVDRQQDLLFAHVWPIDPGHTGERLWRHLDERAWQDLVNLMDTYRAIHRTASDAGTALWA